MNMTETFEENFISFCDKHNCSTCPLYGNGDTSCRTVAKVLSACYKGNVEGTIEVLIKTLEVIQNHGKGTTELRPYGKYCVEKAISALLEIVE